LDESEDVSRKVVEALKAARLAAGLSKYELAKRSGVSRTMIYHLENGGRNSSIITAHALAMALGRDLGEIVSSAVSEKKL
jgi:transcriptional regulator with XRE-family HTH domain